MLTAKKEKGGWVERELNACKVKVIVKISNNLRVRCIKSMHSCCKLKHPLDQSCYKYTLK